MSAHEPDKPISQREILLRLEGKFDSHMVNYTKDQVVIHSELGRRPARVEIVSWISGAGILSGIIFGIFSLFV